MKQQEKTEKEVIDFLQNFKTKLGIWGILFLDDRQKNGRALAELGITPLQRNNVLQELTEIDFSEAREEQFGIYGTEMWIFGKMLKEKETYIKITLGLTNSQVVCISFHISEFNKPMKYPFKK
jgi:hypothetical protein